jgi:hypothetical protein
LGAYLLVVGIALSRRVARGATIVALRIALAGLLVTLSLGVMLAAGLARGSNLPFLTITNIHAAWGLGGWALILLAGVSYYVVPMFQLTPAYPSWLARGMPWLLLTVLLLWSSQFFGFSDGAMAALLLGGFGVAGLFAATTLYLQSRRRRKVSDTTLLFFRTAMLSLLAALSVVVLSALQPVLWDDPRLAVWLGALLLVGVFCSAITGMIYKIVPFLIWLHLQRLGGLNSLPPTMNQMIPDRTMRRQLYMHLGALGLLLGAVWWPAVARFAGLAFALDCALLGLNLLAAVRVYLDFKNRTRAGA